MKLNFKFFTTLTLLMALCSCSSDDDSSPSNVSPEGTWQLTALFIETAFDFNNDGTASQDLFEETECYIGDYVSFDSTDGARVVNGLTFISVEVNSSTDFEYVYECVQGFDVDTTWTQDENEVTIQLLGNNVVGTISGNTMTVSLPDFFEIKKYDGTDYFDVKEDTVLVFVKV